ncbi:uncharacterized protein G2W53_041672 [Senna tora]|uniref:Uncharacterized protein n=1 Tax=Senna tora TaxID=362788 RepID=A0A834SFE0_9FABA|nr:uncharacterized protein G2W53_041672 [Senna tora]
MAWEERGSCLNIFRTTNRGRILETFTNYEAKDLLRKNLQELRGKRLVAQVSQTRRFALYFRTGVVLMLQLESSWHGRSMDHVLTYFGGQIAVGSQKPSRITRRKTCCAIGSQKPLRITRQNTCYASESNTSVRVVFANRSGFDAPIGVILACEERGSSLNIFRMRNRGQIFETITNYVAKDLLRKSVDHVLTYSRRQIVVGSQKPSRITRQKTCCASESNTSVRVVFANRSGFDAPIGAILAWEKRGSCLNIFRMRNRVVLMLQLESSSHVRSVDHVLTYSGRQITVGSQKHSQITRQKTCCASESNTSVRVVFANRNGFDVPIGVILPWEERGSWINMSGRQIAIGSQKPSRITRQKTCCASESNTSVRVVFANRCGFDAPIAVVVVTLYLRTGVVLMLQLESPWHGRSVDHVFTYSGRQIVAGSQKPSRITRQKTCCASESKTSVRVVFLNRSGIDAPIGVVLAWEERGSCINIFRMKNSSQISETFTNYEAKDLLRK